MKDIIEAIRERRSVRSFTGTGLSSGTREKLMKIVSKVDNPFGGKFTIRLKEFDMETFRPSTYGMIRGARDFFMIWMEDDSISSLAAGFCFEQVVLQAWMLGLGTCWIAGTFRSSDFGGKEPLQNGERLKVVCPVGTTASKSVIERLARLTAGSSKRRPFSELFFSDNFNTPLDSGNRYGFPLEMLRLAPSSTNSQPWRALVSGNTVHFYYLPKSSLSVLDCGIGLCHFYEAEKYAGKTGTFFHTGNAPVPEGKLKYLISYR